MDASDYQIIRQLFDDYLKMYSSRDDRLTAHFSDDFSGFTGGGDVLVKDREEWVDITRQDFAQVKDPLRIELKDLAIQSLSETIAVTTGFFTIHLPIKDHILSRETARLVMIFRKETSVWKISHSSISIPYHLVRKGEIYPMNELVDRNQFLEKLVAERTLQLSEANNILQQTNENLSREIIEHKQTETALQSSLSLLAASLESTTDGILIVDRQGKITRWNRKFVEMWRIPQEVLSNLDDEKVINYILVQLVDPNQFIDNVRKLYEQPAQSSFEQIEFLDGRVFERYSQPQRIEDTIVGRVWSFHDITERKRAEETINSSNKLLQTVINTAPMRIFFKNKQLRYMGCNNAFAKDAGVVCAEDLIGKDDYQLAWKEQAELYQTDDLHVIESGVPKLSYDEPQTTPGGNHVWLRTSKVPLRNEANEIIGVLGMYEDITDRKQAEIDRTRLVLRQRAILDNLPMMAWLKDTESRLEMINEPYANACGHSVKECIGKTDLDLFPEEMARGYMAGDSEVCQSGQKKQVEEAISTPEGTKWHLTYKTPVYDEQGLVIGTAGIAQDITEHKKAAEALSQSEAHYHSLFDNSLVGVTVTDKSSIFTDANDAFCRMLEYSREELVGKMTISDISHPHDVVKSMDMINKLIRHDIDHFSLEKGYVSKTGKTIPTLIYVRGHYNLDGEYEGTTASILDITERKKADDLLRESNEKFIVAFKNAPVIIAISNLEDGTYLDINQRFIDTFGFSRKEAIGKSSIELGLITESHRQQLLEVIKKKGKIEDVDLAMFTKSGKELFFKYWGESITISNQNRILSISLDITEHRKIEQQLQQAQKMDSVGRLAGGVAHDFNNMLGVILGHAEMAMDQLDPAQPLFSDLEEIRKAASRSADLTRQLLAFARKQTVVPKVLDLNETIEGLLKMLRRLIGEDIDLVWMPGAGLWPVKVDPSQLDQILANLCVNARDSITGVGKIIVETSNGTFDEEFCATYAGCFFGEYVRISMSDTGCGMDRETLSQIFEPFFTTKGVGEGTGLGLSTVYGAVKQNNGFVDVFSEPGQGTIFTINLPRYMYAGTTAPAYKEGAAAPVEGGHETILVVEDEPTILKMTTTMLQHLGYIVIAASTPNEAIRLVEEFVAEIHLLMTDVIMPEMNGRDLAEQLMIIKKGMKCLFMSGYTSDIIANQGVLAEGTHFIQKPFSHKELAVKIRKVLNTEDGKIH